MSASERITVDQDRQVSRASGAAAVEVDVVTVATRCGRAVWSPRCASCGASAEPTGGMCPCGSEYLGNGWWWIPGGEEETPKRRGAVPADPAEAVPAQGSPRPAAAAASEQRG